MPVPLALFLAVAVGSVLLTLGTATGSSHLPVGIASGPVLTLFFAGLVWLIAEVMDQGPPGDLLPLAPDPPLADGAEKSE